MLPGTTFSNMLERGDYDAARHACLSLNAFWQILHIFLLDIYAQRYHEGVGGIPAKLWDACLQSGMTPCLHSNAQEVRLLLSPGETRTLQRSGIEFEHLRYQSPDLARLRTQCGKGALVPLKYDPADVSKIYLLDPTQQGEWIPVPCVEQDYTCNLSLWKHRKICRYLNHQKKTIDIYALAEAKQHIQEIVSKEFQTTRKNRGRKTAARFLDIGTDASSASVQTERPASPREPEEQQSAIEVTDPVAVSPTKPKHRRSRLAQPASQTMSVENEVRRKSYGGSYDLP